MDKYLKSNIKDYCIYRQIYIEVSILSFHCYHIPEYYIYVKLLNQFAVRYHQYWAERYRLDMVYLHKFRDTQLLYGSVTLARCAALPYRYSLPPTTSRGFLSILTVDFPSLLRSLVNLTFGSTHMARLRRLALSLLRLPYLLPHCGFPFSAPQLGKSYVRKKAMQ